MAGAAPEVAPALLGCLLVHASPDGLVAVRLSEVEAYAGGEDPASHAYRGPTPRTRVMFGAAGHAYVYFSYGMHWCLNVVTGRAGTAAAVLLRAGEVVAGEALAASRRPGSSARDLARGPARLTRCLGLGSDHDGADLCAPGARLRLEHGPAVAPEQVRAGPRVGVNVGVEAPWRFFLAGDRTVSTFRPGTPRRARRSAPGAGAGAAEPAGSG